MNLELTDEQAMLREAAANALARVDTVGGARAARDGGEPTDIWPLAREAGWPGLLVAEEHGGAGLGLHDAMLVLTECGRRITGSGLIGHLAATLVLDRAARAGDRRAAAALPDLASGERRAALVFARPPLNGDGWLVDAPGGGTAELPAAELDGDEARVSGSAGYVPDLAGADLLLVPALAGSEVRVVLLEAGAKGVEVERLVRGDASRPLGEIRLQNAAGEPIDAGPQPLAEAWHCAQALLASDALGVCEATLEMSVAYAKDRHAFARPIGSYQAVKHQLVEILHRTEKLRSLCIYVAYAADAEPEDLPLATATARLAAEAASDYATRTCIAVHGGIGATWEHDAPWFWRRAQLSRLLLGGESSAADRIAAEAITRAKGAK